jgi:uncharacterized protein
MNKILYHGNCYDGFGAAYAAWKYFGDNAEYYPMYYGQELPEINRGDNVFFLDYSRKRDDLVNLLGRGVMVEIHDHHKSAVDEVSSADGIAQELYGIGFTRIVMNMEKSGSVLAWERFHQGAEIPRVLLDIQDRDLWKFEREFTKEVHAALCSYPFDFDIWDSIISYSHLKEGSSYPAYLQLVNRGRLILEYHERLIDTFCQQAELTNIAGHRVPCVNISMLFSEVPHKLLELYPDAPFSAYRYFRKGGVVQYGLRGRGDFDVSEIAKQFGGGGHKSAAGYELKEVS